MVYPYWTDNSNSKTKIIVTIKFTLLFIGIMLNNGLARNFVNIVL
jgi:hypothetical protein